MQERAQRNLTLSQEERYTLKSLKIFQHDTFPQGNILSLIALSTNSER